MNYGSLIEDMEMRCIEVSGTKEMFVRGSVNPISFMEAEVASISYLGNTFSDQKVFDGTWDVCKC